MKQTFRTAGCERDDIVVYFWYCRVNCDVVMPVILGDLLLGRVAVVLWEEGEGRRAAKEKCSEGKSQVGQPGEELAAATQQSTENFHPERESMKSGSAANWDSFFPNVRPNSIREFRRGPPHPLPASTWAVLGGTNSRHNNFPSLDCVVQGSTMLGRRLRNS